MPPLETGLKSPILPPSTANQVINRLKREISDGKPWYKKWWAIGLGVGVVAVVAVAVGGGGGEDTPPEDTTLPGFPRWALLAAGSPKPIVPRPPELMICRGNFHS